MDEAAFVALLVSTGVPPAHGDGLQRLTPYAVKYRYDDTAPNLVSGEDAKVVVTAILFWAEAQAVL